MTPEVKSLGKELMLATEFPDMHGAARFEMVHGYSVLHLALGPWLCLYRAARAFAGTGAALPPTS